MIFRFFRKVMSAFRKWREKRREEKLQARANLAAIGFLYKFSEDRLYMKYTEKICDCHYKQRIIAEKINKIEVKDETTEERASYLYGKLFKIQERLEKLEEKCSKVEGEIMDENPRLKAALFGQNYR